MNGEPWKIIEETTFGPLDKTVMLEFRFGEEYETAREVLGLEVYFRDGKVGQLTTRQLEKALRRLCKKHGVIKGKGDE